MAQMIMNEASEKVKELYGESLYPISSLVTEKAEAWMHETIYDKIFDERDSTHHVEGYSDLTEMDDFAPSSESGEYPNASFEVGHTKYVPNLTWKNKFTISQELIEDMQLMKIKKAPDKFFSSEKRTKERFFAALLGGAIKQNTEFKLGGVNFDLHSADGDTMFSKNHMMKIAKRKQSNIFSNEFSAEALGAIITEMQDLQDDNGNTLDLAPDTIIIPNIWSLKKAVITALASEKMPGSSDNDANTLFGQMNIIVNPYLNQFIKDGTAPFIVFDSNYNKYADGAIYQKRLELTLTPDVASNDDMIWKGRERYSGAFVDFRCMCVGGITGGTTLSA